MADPRTRSCSDCGAPITRQAKTGRCRSCCTLRMRADPEKEARRMAGQKATMAKPEYREKMRRSRKRVEAERRDDPAWQAYKRAGGLKLRAAFEASPEAMERLLATRSAVGAKLAENALGWCPVELRAEYTRLRKKHGKVEARRLIVAGMTPFERQLMRVREGARLVTVQPIRSADPSYTLGGVATGML